MIDNTLSAFFDDFLHAPVLCSRWKENIISYFVLYEYNRTSEMYVNVLSKYINIR